MNADPTTPSAQVTAQRAPNWPRDGRRTAPDGEVWRAGYAHGVEACARAVSEALNYVAALPGADAEQVARLAEARIRDLSEGAR